MDVNRLFPRLTVSTLVILRLTFYFSSYFVLSVSPVNPTRTCVSRNPSVSLLC